MKKRIVIPLIVLLFAAGIWIFRGELRLWFAPPEQELSLSGNVDDRQLNLSFLIAERIAELLPEEGTAVKKGELLGTLETVRIENDIAAAKANLVSAEAAVAAAKAAYDKAQNGSRIEDIAMARAGTAAIEAKIKAAELDFQRQKILQKTDAVSAQTAESAEAQYFFLKAGLSAIQSYLAKLTTGERIEDIAAAAARFEQAKAEQGRAKAELAIREQRLKDAKLYAPNNGIIRKRLLEPGEMSGPQIPALTLAIVSPKWVRVYMPEVWLTKVKSGDKALIHFDGADREFEGWVGFISPNAEFTPKNVETPELRTSLVYEYRVYVNDPENKLKLGAPATVTFPGIMVK